MQGVVGSSRPSGIGLVLRRTQAPPPGFGVEARQICCHASSQATRFHGEWSGTSASFSRDGKALSLPGTYVPREYQEWGIQLKDWASLTSITASDDEPAVVNIQTRFMLPTVGCEADATSFVEDKREYITLGTVSESVPQAEPPEAQQRTAVLHGTGTHYAAGPAYLPLTGKVLIECGALVAPGKRVRLRMPLRKWNEENEWVVEKLEVISEEYSGPYKGGRELPMSCGAEGGFSGDPAVPDETAATIQEAFAEWKSADTWLQESMGDQSFTCLPCGCAVRFTMDSGRVGLQAAFLAAMGDGASDSSQGTDDHLVQGKVAVVSMCVGRDTAFVGDARLVDLAKPVLVQA